MATLEQIELALRAADAAGNTEDATRLAQAYAQMRDSQLSPQAAPQQAPKPAERKWQDSAKDVVQAGGRSLGLGVRSMAEGAGSLIGIASDPLTAGMNALTGSRASGARETAGQLSDMIGLPRPETATERVSGNITEGLTGGGGFLATGRALAARAPGLARNVGTMLSSMPGTQVAAAAGGSGASGVTRESGGGQGAQVVAGLVGGLSPAVAGTGGSMLLRGAARGGEAGRQTMERGIADFRMAGAQPSAGQAAGNRRLQGLESLLSGGPTSGGVMVRAAERQADDVGGGLRRLADNFTPNASSERAGRAVEKGVDTFAGNVKATRKALYWQADQLIPDTVRLPLTRTQQTLRELTALTPGAESTTAALVNPKIAQMAQNVGDDLLAAQATRSGGLPYSAVKDIRSRIGEELSDFSLTTDKPTAQYKRLYAALSQDLEEAARSQGPAAAQAAKRANGYFKASTERLEQVQRVVDKNGGPEKVYAAVMSGTQDGGTTLRAVMQSLPQEGQKAVTAAVIKRMGLATKGNQDAAGEQFSAQTFLTNWNGVSAEARKALFDRHGPKFASDMDRIARVAERIRNGSKVFANPSGTANKGLAYTYAGSLAGSLLTGQVPAFGALVGGGGLANVAARALTSPRIVSWLAQATEMPVSALPQQIIVLKGIADRTGDEDVADFAAALEQQPPN